MAENLTVAELLDRVEQDLTLTSARDKAVAMVRMVPPPALPAVAMRVTALLLELRTRRGRDTTTAAGADDTRVSVDTPARSVDPPRPSSAPIGVRGAAQRAATRHASARIQAATKAWRDLLATKVPVDGVPTEVQDMSVRELTTLADTLYDASERLHALARTVDEHHVVCARHLPATALAAVGDGSWS